MSEVSKFFLIIFLLVLISLVGARAVRAATLNELLAKIAELQNKVQILQKQLAEIPPPAPQAPLAPFVPSSPVLSPGLKLGDQTILSPFGLNISSQSFSSSPFALTSKITAEINPFAPALKALRGSTTDLAYFVLTAPGREAVNIDTLTIKTNEKGRHLRNLRVVTGGLGFGSAQSSLQGNDTIAFSASEPLSIPAGESYGIQVAGDILSSAPTGTTSGLITLVSCSGQGVKTFGRLSCSPTNLQGQNVTIVHNPLATSFFSKLPLAINYPNGGEQLQIGMNHKIKWGYATQAPFLPADQLAKNIRIELWRAGPSLVTSRYYPAPLPADFDFLIPNYALPGSDYKIRVIDADQPENYGESANDFNLVR